MSWPVAVAMVAIVATAVSMVVLFRPAARDAPRARPLGSTGSRPTGQEGGLVPDVQVLRDGGARSPVRAFRPAILVLAPAGCGCAAVLRTVLEVAGKHNVYAVAIGPDLPALPGDLQHTTLIRAADADHGLLPAYGVRDKPVLLLVRDDGIVNRILSDAPPVTVLDPEVVVLTA
jgi:hypothetical protein